MSTEIRETVLLRHPPLPNTHMHANVHACKQAHTPTHAYGPSPRPPTLLQTRVPLSTDRHAQRSARTKYPSKAP
eukprot:13979381-Alexandrium_andersonii.AAC.1